MTCECEVETSTIIVTTDYVADRAMSVEDSYCKFVSEALTLIVGSSDYNNNRLAELPFFLFELDKNGLLVIKVACDELFPVSDGVSVYKDCELCTPENIGVLKAVAKMLDKFEQDNDASGVYNRGMYLAHLFVSAVRGTMPEQWYLSLSPKGVRELFHKVSSNQDNVIPRETQRTQAARTQKLLATTVLYAVTPHRPL